MIKINYSSKLVFSIGINRDKVENRICENERFDHL